MASLERPRTRMLAVASASLFLSVLVWFNYSAVLPLIVADWYPEADRGTAMGVYVGTFSASSGLSFLLAGSPPPSAGGRRSPRPASARSAVPLVLGVGYDAPGAERAGGRLNWACSETARTSPPLGSTPGTTRSCSGCETGSRRSCSRRPRSRRRARRLGGPGNFLGGALSDRVGRLRAIAVALAASGLIGASLGLLRALPLAVLAAIVFAYGVVLTMDSAPTSTAVTELVDDEGSAPRCRSSRSSGSAPRSSRRSTPYPRT